MLAARKLLDCSALLPLQTGAATGAPPAGKVTGCARAELLAEQPLRPGGGGLRVRARYPVGPTTATAAARSIARAPLHECGGTPGDHVHRTVHTPGL